MGKETNQKLNLVSLEDLVMQIHQAALVLPQHLASDKD